jgi:urocanate hydratase
MISTLHWKPHPREFVRIVESFYAGLILAAKPSPDAEPGLGGKLLYAGQLDAKASALLLAANIAGAASLAFSADAAAGKQAIRNGVVDFLVTSLDEALRILKNEIRKRSTVAVCVAPEPQSTEADFARQLLERGVLPDLLPTRSAPAPEFASFLSQGSRLVVAIYPDDNQVLLDWKATSAPAQWMPKLDALALDCLSADPNPAVVAPGRRWLRLAPRYLGRIYSGSRLLRCDESTAKRFLDRVWEQVASGEIGVNTEVSLIHAMTSQWHLVSPPRHL